MKTIAIVVCVAALGFAAYMFLWPKPVCWNEPAHLQILGDEDELYVFASVQRLCGGARRLNRKPVPGRPWAGVPGHDEIIVIGKEGVRDRFRNEGPDDPLIHPNIGQAFRHKGLFYIYEPASLGEPKELFAWTNGGYMKLPPQEAAERIEKYNISGDTVDGFSQAEGFTRVLGGWNDSSFIGQNDASFEWNGIPMTVVLTEQDCSFSYSFSSTNPAWPNTVVIEIDREYARLTEHERNAAWGGE